MCKMLYYLKFYACKNVTIEAGEMAIQLRASSNFAEPIQLIVPMLGNSQHITLVQRNLT